VITSVTAQPDRQQSTQRSNARNWGKLPMFDYRL
jgi:hypothetical protein